MMRKRYTVLCYIIGGYEKVHEIGKMDPDCEYLLVTDDPQLTSKTWTVIYDSSLSGEDAFARCYAIRFNLFKYATTDICVYLDASIQVHRSLRALVDRFEEGHYDVSLMPHPRHDVFLPEYADWVNVRNYPVEQQEKFFTMLRRANYDLSYRSLFQLCYRIVRRSRTNDRIDRMVLAFLWYLGDGDWIERLDQTVYSYVLNVWFNDLRVMPVSEQILRSDYLTWCLHGSDEPNKNVCCDTSLPDVKYVFNRPRTCLYLLPGGVSSEKIPDGASPTRCLDVAESGSDVIALRAEIMRLRQMTSDWQRKCESLQSSTCWRLTAPVRKALDYVKAIVRRKGSPLYERLVRGDDILESCPDERLPVVEDRVSVVIPTYRAGDGFKKLLDRLNGQRNVKDLEIVVVDSGSEDGTPEVARAAGAVVLQIPHEEFNHAATRNLAVEKSTGKYVVMMTQDALPEDDYWAARMLRPIVTARASAVVCRQKPHPGCSLFGRYQVRGLNWILSYEADRIVSWPDAVDYLTLRRHAQLNDVACAIERELLLKFRYRYGYGEDLDLGIRLLRTGHRIAKLASVSVIHSHDRSAFYDFKRTLVDVPCLKQIMPTAPVELLGREIVIGRILTAHDVLASLCASLRTTPEQRNWSKALGLVCRRGQELLESRSSRDVRDETRGSLTDVELESVVRDVRNDFAMAEPDKTLAVEMLSTLRDDVPRVLAESGLIARPASVTEIANFLEHCFAVGMGALIAAYAYWHRQEADVLTRIYGECAKGI